MKHAILFKIDDQVASIFMNPLPKYKTVKLWDMIELQEYEIIGGV